MNCKLIFADGTELNNLTMNGNVYASKVEVTADTLNEDALVSVRVVPTEGEEFTLRYVKYDTIYRVGDEWHFALVGANEDEIKLREMQETNDMLTECILEMSEIIYA